MCRSARVSDSHRMTIMRSRARTRTLLAVCATIASAVALSVFASAAAPRFYDDDPVWAERDTQDASKIKPLEVDLFVDLTYNLLANPGDPRRVRAMNVNTVDEVP